MTHLKNHFASLGRAFAHRRRIIADHKAGEIFLAFSLRINARHNLACAKHNAAVCKLTNFIELM